MKYWSNTGSSSLSSFLSRSALLFLPPLSVARTGVGRLDFELSGALSSRDGLGFAVPQPSPGRPCSSLRAALLPHGDPTIRRSKYRHVAYSEPFVIDEVRPNIPASVALNSCSRYAVRSD
jgi:hypothetical protein